MTALPRRPGPGAGRRHRRDRRLQRRLAHRQQSCRSGPAGNGTACRAIGPPTGSTRSPSSAPASWPRATSTTGSSTASSPSAPTRTGGPRRLRSRPSTPALPGAGERRVPPKRPDSPLPGGRCHRRSLSLTPRSPSSLLPPAIISSKAPFFEVSTRPAPLRRRGCTANLASSASLDCPPCGSPHHGGATSTAVRRRGQPGIAGGR